MNIARIVGVDEHGHSSEARHRGLEQFQALRRGLLGQIGKAGNIAAGMRETRNKAKCHRVRDGEGGLHRIGGGGVDPFQCDAIPQKQVEGLFAADDPIFYEIADKVARLALELRLPGIFQSRRCVDAGALMSFGVDLDDLDRHATTYVDKILRGAKPADLPVEQPTTFNLIINLKTAKAMGLVVPQSLLARADEVIE